MRHVQIGEARELGLEEQPDPARRAVALLAADQLGDVVHLTLVGLPLGVRRLAALGVVETRTANSWTEVPVGELI